MNWKDILKNLRPETLVRPDEEDRTRSDNVAWLAPMDAVMPTQDTETSTKTGDCAECEFITSGSMDDRAKSKSDPNTPGKCRECATHWCDINHNDQYSDSGKCGFRVCDKHYKLMTKNGKQPNTRVGGHHFGDDTGNYDTDRRQSDYGDDGQFDEDKFNRRQAKKEKK